jgi:hypothetical protein
MIDHTSQLLLLQPFCEKAGLLAGTFLKVDIGYQPAGLPPHSLNKDQLVKKFSKLHANGLVILWDSTCTSVSATAILYMPR